MVSSQDIKNSVLSVPEQRYFESMGKSFTDMEWALEDALSETSFRGVAVNAPTSIALKQHVTLPILMAIQETRLRSWEVPVGYNCILVATDLSRRTVYFGQVFRDPPNKIPIPMDELPQPSKPTGTNAISVSSGIDRIDARELLSLPWEPGRYRFTVLLFDWMSNSVDVELTGGDTTPAVGAPLLKLNPANAGINHGLPTFIANAEVLPRAQKNLPIVTFNVTMGTIPGPLLKTTGKFSIVADASHLSISPFTIKEANGQEKTVAAAVPVTLAVFGKNWPNPLRRDWILPVYSEHPIKTGNRVEGYFSIDALEVGKPTLAPGDYVAYLILEGHMFGPVAFSSAPAVK